MIASVLERVTLARVGRAATGTEFGFVYHEGLTALTVKAPPFRFDPMGAAVQDLSGTDFEVKRA